MSLSEAQQKAIALINKKIESLDSEEADLLKLMDEMAKELGLKIVPSKDTSSEMLNEMVDAHKQSEKESLRKLAVNIEEGAYWGGAPDLAKKLIPEHVFISMYMLHLMSQGKEYVNACLDEGKLFSALCALSTIKTIKALEEGLDISYDQLQETLIYIGGELGHDEENVN